MECEPGTWCFLCYPRASFVRTIVILAAVLSLGALVGWTW